MELKANVEIRSKTFKEYLKLILNGIERRQTEKTARKYEEDG